MTAFASRSQGLRRKVKTLAWPFVLLVALVGAIGCAMLYSAAGGDLEPWAWRHAIRLLAGLAVVVLLALIDPRLWFKLAYPAYGLALCGLFAVAIIGQASMGARRWIDLGVVQLQPSEFMKPALVLALARYFHNLKTPDLERLGPLLMPTMMIVLPVALVLQQPDLGTSIMLAAAGWVMFFAAGVSLWYFVIIICSVLVALPVLWGELHGYQKQRVLTFLDPERDPLGSGYHIIQSKIALGSGGIHGKGFLQGTQSQLSFLPEKHTDFVFAMLAEEFGMIGALTLLLMLMTLIAHGMMIALRARHQFGRLLAIGVSFSFFLYVMINIAMVTGIVPVVGVPLPMISYGGTAMIAMLAGFGLLLGIDLHPEMQARRWERQPLSP